MKGEKSRGAVLFQNSPSALIFPRDHPRHILALVKSC
jgi:hypothetical protein